MDTVHDLAVHLDLAPLEPDVGGVVVAARGGAAGPAHADRSGLADVLLELLREGNGARLGVDEGQVAEVRARARDEAAADLRRVVGKLFQERLLGQVAEHGIGDVGEEHVLRGHEAELSAPVAVGQPRQLIELVGGDATHRGLEPHVVETGLALPEDADVVAMSGPARVPARPRQGPLEARLELFPEALRSPLGEQEGQARLAARFARSVVAVDEGDGRADRRRLLGAHEGVEGPGERRPTRALLAPHRHVEAGDLLAVGSCGQGRRHRDVLRLP